MTRPTPRLAAACALSLLLLAQTPLTAQEQGLDDAEIADAIEDQFLVDGVIDVNRIDVTVREGIAELTGTVGNLMAKERAARVAGRIKGVRAVIDRIQVAPAVVLSDRGIERDVSRALFDDPATDSYEIDVEVDDKIVSLTGEVDSWAELRLAEKVAKSVRGVVGIDNQIEVNPDQQREDDEIREEVQQRLRWSLMIEDGLVDVAVEKGEVILSGTVGSLEEKRLAESLARVAGVTSVDTSALEVQWWADDEDLRDDKYVQKDDEAIAAAVEDALLYHPRVASFQVEPEVFEGWVTLRGRVDNLHAKDAAAEVARNTVGVAGVTNRIKVRPDEDPTDEMIEADIRGRLVINPFTDADDMVVEVDDGQVTLTGVADSYVEKSEARRIAAKAPGVTRVRNQVMVEQGALGRADPHLGPFLPGMSAVQTIPSRRDQELHDEIVDELWWDPFVDSDNVNLNVTDGQATLRGRVETWRAYHAAEENAYEGGATFVRNRLEVR